MWKYCLADKVKAAYRKCFGNDYDFDDLAINSGSSDADSDGLPDSFEGEALLIFNLVIFIFYRE